MNRWNDNLWLLTLEEYEQLSDGVRLQCIDNEIVTKGKNYIVITDTRFGCIAYGLTKELVEEQNLQHDFLIMLLKS